MGEKEVGSYDKRIGKAIVTYETKQTIMKVLFLTLLFAWFLISTCGQKLNDIDKALGTGSYYDIVVMDTSGNRIFWRQDSVLIIQGDTIAAIQLAFRYFKTCSEESRLYRERFDTAKMIYLETKYRDELKW